MNNQSELSGHTTDNTQNLASKPAESAINVAPMQAADNHQFASIMAQRNNTDLGKLGFTQELKIEDGVKPVDWRVAQKNDAFNPIAPAGQGDLAFDKSATAPTGQTHDREVLPALNFADGGKNSTFMGKLDNGLFKSDYFATGFTGSEEIDKNGSLTHRDINYSGGHANLKFEDENGKAVKIDDVKSVVTDRAVDGHYKTTIENGGGMSWLAESSASGKTLSLSQGPRSNHSLILESGIH